MAVLVGYFGGSSASYSMGRIRLEPDHTAELLDGLVVARKGEAADVMAARRHAGDRATGAPNGKDEDFVWSGREVERNAATEPLLSNFLYNSILAHDSFEKALAFVLSNRLANAVMLPNQLFEIIYAVLISDPHVREGALADVEAWRDGDLKEMFDIASLQAGAAAHPNGSVLSLFEYMHQESGCNLLHKLQPSPAVSRRVPCDPGAQNRTQLVVSGPEGHGCSSPKPYERGDWQEKAHQQQQQQQQQQF
eukprot:gene1497-biopygen2844